MLGQFLEGEEEDQELPKKKKKAGRPQKYGEPKKLRNMRLTDYTWGLLETIGGGNRTEAVEELVEDYFKRLKEETKQ